MSPYHLLGPKRGPAVYERRHGTDHKHRVGENLYPTHISDTFRDFSARSDLTVERVEPRYWPWAAPITKVPGLREVVTWNCVVRFVKARAPLSLHHMAEPKSFNLSPEIHQYLVAHGTPPDEVQQALIERTSELGGISMMQIAPEQGAFMTILTRLIGVKVAVEVGTFTGYSSLCIARGLADGGQLICCDVSDEWTAIGVEFWKQAGVADRIDLRIAPALDTINAMPDDEHIDLVFIDADKENYANYYEALLPRLRTNGVILVDNTLWSGAVIDPARDDSSTVAIRAFNDMVAADDRVDAVQLAISDGLTLLRKR